MQICSMNDLVKRDTLVILLPALLQTLLINSTRPKKMEKNVIPFTETKTISVGKQYRTKLQKIAILTEPSCRLSAGHQHMPL